MQTSAKTTNFPTYAYAVLTSRRFVLFCLPCNSQCACGGMHDYRRLGDDFPTLKFGVVMADLLTSRQN